jgi:hypothetical protein
MLSSGTCSLTLMVLGGDDSWPGIIHDPYGDTLDFKATLWR